MPDFERPLRKLELYLNAKDPQAVREIKAYHRGKDDARKEILAVVGVIALIIIYTALFI